MLNWRRLQWVVIPVLVLGGVEWWVRHTADRLPTWYGAAEQIASEAPIGAVFVGSSRIQAAVVPRQFADALGTKWTPDRQALNLARGYSTEAEHFLGLRNLIDKYPAALRGVYVFAEAPGGLPFRAGWADTPWAFAEQPWMLVDLLKPSDLPVFWKAPGLDVEQRLHVALRSMVRSARVFNRRERVRQQWLEQVLPQLAAGRLPDLQPNLQVGYDLQGPGNASSIRVDPAAVAQARASAVEVAGLLERQQAPMRNWNDSIQEALARLVRQHGGQVVFLAPPLSEPFQRIYRTAVRQEDIAYFARQAAEWGSCVVRPDFTYTDEDLPDLWHLKPELAPAYTQALARTFQEQCPGVQPAGFAAR